MKRFWISGLYHVSVLLLGAAHIKVLFFLVDKAVLDQFFYFQALVLFAGTIPAVAMELVFQHFVPKSRKGESRALLGMGLILFSLFYAVMGLLIALMDPRTPAFVVFFLPFTGLSLLVSYSRAARRFHLANAMYLTSLALTVLGLLITHPRSPAGVGMVYGIASSIPFFGGIVILSPLWRISGVKSFLRYTLYSFASVLTSPIMRYWDRIILERISPGDVAGLTLIRRIDWFFRQILSSFMIWLIPRMSRGGNRTAKVVFPSYLLLSTGLFVMEVLAGKWIIELFSTSQYVKYYPLLIIFATAFLISSIYSFRMTLMRLSGKIDRFLLHNYIFSATFIAATLLLSGFSAKGIALSFLVATITGGSYIVISDMLEKRPR